MSISAFQEKIKKGGCAQIVLGASAFVMFVSMFYSCNRAGSAGGQKEKNDVAITVGSVPVYEGEIQEALANAQRSQGGPDLDKSPADEARDIFYALRSLIDAAATVQVAKEKKIEFSDEAITKAYQASMEQQMMQIRLQMMMGKQIKPDATDADFEVEFKKMTGGKSIADIKKEDLAKFKSKLGDSAARELMIRQFGRQLLVDSLGSTEKISDEELKKSFQDVTVKRILIPIKTPDAEKKAQEALAAIKSGTPFETVMERYSEELAPKDKKKSEVTSLINQRTIDTEGSYKDLRGLANGQVSGVIKMNDGFSIYKVVGVATKLPADFEKTKETYRKNIQNTNAQTVASKLIETAVEKAEWKDKAAKLVYDYQKLTQDPKMTSDPRSLEEKLRVIAKEAKGLQGEKSANRLATLAWYLAIQQIYVTPGVDKVALGEEKVSSTLAVLQHTESQAMRLELAEIFTQQKKFAEAGDQITLALKNLRKYDTAGDVTFRDLSARFLKVKSEGNLPTEKTKDFEDAQARWKEDKAMEEKFAAEAKAAEEERKKQDAEAAKKAAEEDAKKKPAGTAPTTGSTTPPPATSGALPGLPGGPPAAPAGAKK